MSRSARSRRTSAAAAATVNDLFPDGETALYDATEAGVRTIQKLKDDARINAVVVLTDGEDNQSQHDAPTSWPRELHAPGASEGLGVRVYTIAYGQQANKDVLARIAAASGGKALRGRPRREIESVYR